MSLAPERLSIGIRRHFTAPGVHPYDQVVWERRDAQIKNWKDGSVAFEQLGVEFPVSWSLNATNIVSQKYFRGTPGTSEREDSMRQVIDRVADTITKWGVECGYFIDQDEAESFCNELKFILITQRAAFNSPVWFNIGVSGVPQQASACFILAVDDTMDAILNWYKEEGTIFKGGSGAGINLSNIRSSAEHLKGGGTASGPVSFMRGADASAGTIKSGGKLDAQPRWSFLTQATQTLKNSSGVNRVKKRRHVHFAMQASTWTLTVQTRSRCNIKTPTTRCVFLTISCKQSKMTPTGI